MLADKPGQWEEMCWWPMVNACVFSHWSLDRTFTHWLFHVVWTVDALSAEEISVYPCNSWWLVRVLVHPWCNDCIASWRVTSWWFKYAPESWWFLGLGWWPFGCIVCGKFVGGFQLEEMPRSLASKKCAPLPFAKATASQNSKTEPSTAFHPLWQYHDFEKKMNSFQALEYS